MVKAYERLAKTSAPPNDCRRRPSGSGQFTRTAYGREWSCVPTVGMIIAFDSIDLLNLGNQFKDIVEDWPIEHRPDSIWVIGKGFLVWTDTEGRIDFIPMTEESDFMLCQQDPEPDVALPLVLCLYDCFQSAFMPPLRLSEYAGDAALATATARWTVIPEHGDR